MIRWTRARKFELITDMLKIPDEQREAWLAERGMSLDEANEWLGRLRNGGVGMLRATRRSKGQELTLILMKKRRGRIPRKKRIIA